MVLSYERYLSDKEPDESTLPSMLKVLKKFPISGGYEGCMGLISELFSLPSSRGASLKILTTHSLPPACILAGFQAPAIAATVAVA